MNKQQNKEMYEYLQKAILKYNITNIKINISEYDKVLSLIIDYDS